MLSNILKNPEIVKPNRVFIWLILHIQTSSGRTTPVTTETVSTHIVPGLFNRQYQRKVLREHTRVASTLISRYIFSNIISLNINHAQNADVRHQSLLDVFFRDTLPRPERFAQYQTHCPADTGVVLGGGKRNGSQALPISEPQFCRQLPVRNSRFA